MVRYAALTHPTNRGVAEVLEMIKLVECENCDRLIPYYFLSLLFPIISSPPYFLSPLFPIIPYSLFPNRLNS